MEVQNMSSHVWRLIYQMVRRVDSAIRRTGRKRRYSDGQIVGMYLWSVAWDRPMSWCCDRSNYNQLFQPRRLPSISQFCRRIKTARCQKILQQVYDRLAKIGQFSSLLFIDGRPLAVGSCSRDTDAERGRICGGYAKGYKLHTLVSMDQRVLNWSVTPLNTAETTVATELIKQTGPRTILLGDGNYDSGNLYDLVAQVGGRLITPLPKNAGKGHRKQSPVRLEAIEEWKTKTTKFLYKKRIGVEQCFGNQSNFGGGLGPLPAWVRSLERVTRWVGAKLMIYHARLSLRRAVKS